ncbi:hydroxyacid dehydrogenase [Microbacterium invictum]|uniref:Hydroxyacid dehydrogenase n=1 Tax=Microbacterium invictum TaxID=515415 RepID=A0ABZ0VAN4_9MICO|nr:hydroxyacid dehydrogenase [Microbacterium invictum]WQB70692.1 hydroxyacid dehydrogenase [Microbacterium invictum]
MRTTTDGAIGVAHSDAPRPGAIVLMSPTIFERVWGPAERRRLAKRLDVIGTPGADLGRYTPEQLASAQFLITGWGAPPLDGLPAMPNLKLVLHAAGSVRSLATPEFWRRGIPVVSAIEENTRPTAEFASAEIVYALKRGWHAAARLRRTRDWDASLPSSGIVGSTVGLVSLGRVGRLVAARLASIGGIRILAFDPYSDAVPGVEFVDLNRLFEESDVVSLHTPITPETVGLVGEAQLRSLKEGATLINTSRGAIIDEAALVRTLRARPDLFAALDVTESEPLAPDSALYDLENVILTPHIAGSSGRELHALAHAVMDQYDLHRRGALVRSVGADDRPIAVRLAPTAG